MPQELIVRALSLKQALEIASEKLSTRIQDLSYEIIEKPEKHLFGKNKDGIFKIWRSPLLDAVLNHFDRDTYKKQNKSKEKERDTFSSVDDTIVIVKDTGIFVKLDPIMNYTADMIRNALKKRGVLDNMESHISEILSVHPTEFKKMAEFTGNILDKSDLLLTFNEDNTKAYITMKKPKNPGGPTCSYEEIVNFLKDQNINYGIRFSNIKILNQREVLDTPIVVAIGKPAIGELTNAYKKYYLPQDIELPEDDKTNVDLKNHITKYRSFKVGEIICEKVEKSPFVKGVDVFGNSIDTAHQDKAQEALVMGDNLNLSEDGTIVYAGIDGFVNEKDGVLSMSPLLHIKEDIGYSTGNINVMGDLLVTGDVKAGFTVQSTGNITIEGFVQRGIIISDKDVQVKKGIIGGELRVKGSLITYYVDFAKIWTVGNIICKQEITNSLIQCSGYIFLYGSKAAIVGGEIAVKKGIMAKKIGSELQNINITIGLDPLILDVHKQILLQRDKLIHKAQKLQVSVERAKKRRKKNPEATEEEKRLIEQMNNTQLIIEKFNTELINIQEYFDKQKEEGFLSFHGVLYAGVNLNLNRMHIPITEKISNKTIKVENKRIIVVPNETGALEKQILAFYKL